MTINKISVGELSTNCYIIKTDNNNAIIIDAGANAKGIMDFIDKNNLTVKALVLTHGHFDHIGAVSEIKDKTGAKVYIHESDAELLDDADNSMAIHLIDMKNYIITKPDVLLKDGDTIEVDEVKLTVIHTPGHTKGSCVFITGEVMFAGDTLFCGGIGRTDLYGGNMQTMKASLKKLALINDDFTVLSGHGDQTTLSYEKRTNPYMGTNYDDIF